MMEALMNSLHTMLLLDHTDMRGSQPDMTTEEYERTRPKQQCIFEAEEVHVVFIFFFRMSAFDDNCRHKSRSAEFL